jgi:hypothetical protein
MEVVGHKADEVQAPAGEVERVVSAVEQEGLLFPSLFPDCNLERDPMARDGQTHPLLYR